MKLINYLNLHPNVDTKVHNVINKFRLKTKGFLDRVFQKCGGGGQGGSKCSWQPGTSGADTVTDTGLCLH